MEPVVDQRVYSGRYQVTHLIARGGMALVYRAHDLLLNRHVALKILYPELSVDRNFVERFRREAQAAANLSHPNIVPIFDWGEEAGTYFIVMELVEGTSLAELLADKKTLSPAKSAQVVAQVASALSYAHRQGVVHRDVKPGNILLTTDGQVKVTDFGIAQAISTEDNLTVAGSVMGTATYFSPEQAEGALVDGRSDVYSLGVVLYELLAGRPPFIGDSPIAVAGKHVRDAVPSPRQFNAAIPVDLESITMHALAKQPGDRYQTADEMRIDLLRFADGQPVSVNGQKALMGDDITRAVPAVLPVDDGSRTMAVPLMVGPRTDVRKRRRNGPWIAAILLLLLIAGAALAYVLLSKSPVNRMPNVVGEKYAHASATLTNDGFTNLSPAFADSKLPRGVVIKTIPTAGTKVKHNALITLFVSTGQSGKPLTVPDVRFLPLTQAESTLQQAHLQYKSTFVTTLTGGYPPGTVINQSPLPPSKIKTGQTVNLTVVGATATFTLPDVSGQTPTQAANTLGTDGLKTAATNLTKCSNTVPRNNVVGTNPPAGQQVASGQTIQLVTSSGVCTVAVPNVTGDTQSAATAALTAPAYSLVPNYHYLTPSDHRCIVGGQPQFDYVSGTTPGANQPTKYGSSVIVYYCPPATNPPPSSTTTTVPPTTTTT